MRRLPSSQRTNNPGSFLDDFAATLHGKSIFSSIDLVRAFNQIPVGKEDIAKTAIITPFELFESPVMTFGLRNAAQTFQRIMDEVTRDLPFVFPLIDDVLVASTSEEVHLQHLKMLFEKFQEHGLIINVAKSHSGKTEVEFLGHVVTQ